jgi:DUF971 family protein
MPGDPRTEPASVKVFLTTGEGLAIEWRDHHQSRYDFPYLRDHCPCATCRERGRDTGGKASLPIYKEPVRAVQAEPVGHYALRFTFSDGHGTGIYSYEYLRDVCPCADCRAAAARPK